MATTKQCKMLAARAKEAGMPYEFDDFKELDNGAVDEKLAEIKAYKKEPESKQTEQKMNKEPEFNGQRFGSVYKIVRDKWSDYEVRTKREQFLQDLIFEYDLSIAGEEAVKAFPPRP